MSNRGLIRYLVLIVGLIVLIPSAFVFRLIVLESMSYGAAYDAFELDPWYCAVNDPSVSGPAPKSYVVTLQGTKITARLKKQSMSLSDDIGLRPLSDRPVKGSPKIWINGKFFKNSHPTIITTDMRNTDRYAGLHIVGLLDKKTGLRSLVLVQIRPAGNFDFKKLRCNLLFLDENGSKREEDFPLTELKEPAYRIVLANMSSPMALGRTGQETILYPTGFYPILFPFLSLIFGFTLSACATYQLVKQK